MERVLLCAGTVWPVKGQAVLISALKHLNADHPNLHCVLIGDQDERYAQSLSRFVDNYGLARNVQLLPFCEDLRVWWRAADAAICPSESESMSASLLEAMAFGLPALTCRVGGATEALEDGISGWLCEPNDLGSMIDGLTRVAAATSVELEALGNRAAFAVALAHRRSESSSRMTELLWQLSRGTIPAWCGD
jgi:D-inositol-3-phosphate glycosyltransferase